jgi:hypothetical protein
MQVNFSQCSEDPAAGIDTELQILQNAYLQSVFLIVNFLNGSRSGRWRCGAAI